MHNPTIAQITPGRFHHFDLARQLLAAGFSTRIYTTYPKWKLQSIGEFENINANIVDTYPWYHVPFMALSKYGQSFEWLSATTNRLRTASLLGVDKYCSNNLPPGIDIIIGQSGCGLTSGRKVKNRGGKYICDRGSSHILFQEKLLLEEYGKWGIAYKREDPKIIEQELQEYTEADAITVPSIYSRATFVAQGVSPEKIHLINYGVDTKLFFPATSRTQRDTFTVLYAGGITLRKGIPYLLEAFQKVAHKKKKLILAGIVSQEILEILSRPELSKLGTDTDFLGHIPQSRLREIMASADVLVLPTLDDGFGLVLAQAMACGCPIISTTNSGAPDLITDGMEGYIVSPGNSDEIADALQRIADDSELRGHMGELALQRVKQLGGWDTYGSLYGALLKQLHCEA